MMTYPVSEASRLTLASGEIATVEVIPRPQAIDILSKPVSRRTWFGQKYRSSHRTSRGPGPAADLLNFGMIVKGNCRAVIRLGMAPWGNRPAIAAVGASLAKQTAYLSRLWASGISSDDLV